MKVFDIREFIFLGEVVFLKGVSDVGDSFRIFKIYW